jgi:hypothetical protein
VMAQNVNIPGVSSVFLYIYIEDILCLCRHGDVRMLWGLDDGAGDNVHKWIHKHPKATQIFF